MKPTVLDCSVLCALLNEEPISDKVFEIMPYSVISTVTLAEAIGIFTTKFKVPRDEALQRIKYLIDNIINFTEEQASLAGYLDIINKQHKFGLSLGDRACISLGISMKLPVYTTDRIWAKIDFPNLEVHVLR